MLQNGQLSLKSAVRAVGEADFAAKTFATTEAGKVSNLYTKARVASWLIR